MKFLAIFLIFTSSLHASIDLADSTLSLTKGPEELCAGGAMKVVGKDSDRSLIVGPRISFSLSQKDDVSMAADGHCREVVRKKEEAEKLVQITTISNCSKEFKNLEGETYEELIVSRDQVIYKNRQGKTTSTCLFKRKLK